MRIILEKVASGLCFTCRPYSMPSAHLCPCSILADRNPFVQTWGVRWRWHVRRLLSACILHIDHALCLLSISALILYPWWGIALFTQNLMRNPPFMFFWVAYHMCPGCRNCWDFCMWNLFPDLTRTSHSRCGLLASSKYCSHDGLYSDLSIYQQGLLWYFIPESCISC